MTSETARNGEIGLISALTLTVIIAGGIMTGSVLEKNKLEEATILLRQHIEKGTVWLTHNGQRIDLSSSTLPSVKTGTWELHFRDNKEEKSCTLPSVFFTPEILSAIRSAEKDNAAADEPATPTRETLEQLCAGKIPALSSEQKQNLAGFGEWLQKNAQASARFQPRPYINPANVEITSLAMGTHGRTL